MICRAAWILFVVTLAHPAAAQLVRDRMLTDVRLERDTARGTWRVLATVSIAISSGNPGGDLSFRLRTTQGGSSGPTVGPDVVVPVTIVTAPSCTGFVLPPCGGGTCPALNVDGAAVSGSCEPYLVLVPGCSTPYQICACYYRGVEKETATEVEADPGDELTVQILPASGALTEVSCYPENQTLSVVVGSRADQPPFDGPWRGRTPMGGQADVAGTGAFLHQSGLERQGEGPYEYWGTPGSTVTLRHGAVGANLPIGLFYGPASTSWLVDANLDWSVDLDVGLMVPIYDSLLGTGGPPAVTGPNGVFEAAYVLPNGTGPLISLQAVSADPAAVLGMNLTSRNDIGLQPVTQPAPAVAPITAPGISTYPWPRDAIVPNHGSPTNAAEDGRGTLHSVVGVGFDAVQPGAVQVSVNGLNAEVVFVRPTEIFFRLRPGHRAGIGGPVSIVSTSGTFVGDPDRMEHQVFVSPPASLVRREAVASSLSTLVGGFTAAPGLQGSRGLLDGDDLWDLGWGNLPAGNGVRVLVLQVDSTTDQAVARCQAPTTCYGTGSFPFTQSPGGMNSLSDLAFDVLPTLGGAPTLAFDDEGPGSSPFGMFATPTATPILQLTKDPGVAPGQIPSYLTLVSIQ